MWIKNIFLLTALYSCDTIPAKNISTKYIITGGECGGKTTIINLLKEHGFQIVPEAFTEAYNQAKACNRLNAFRENHDERNQILTEAQIAREEAIDESQPAFLDRSALEIIFFANYYQSILAPTCIAMIGRQKYAPIVFLVDLLPEQYYEQTEIRMETREDSLRIHAFLKDCYKKRGFTIITVPFGTPEERALFILKTIKCTTKRYLNQMLQV